MRNGFLECVAKRIVLGAFVAAAVVCGGSKGPSREGAAFVRAALPVGTTAPSRPDDAPNGEGAARSVREPYQSSDQRDSGRARSPNAPQTVAQEDIARGYRFVGEATEDIVYTMPPNATLVGNWHRRGTFGEWLRYELGWAFPLGADGAAYSSFSVFNDAKIRPTPRDRSHEICAVGVPMLAMQGASRFWVADGSDGETALTWENFFLNADTNQPINAQIVLYENGDFVTRSNEVARYYARIDPHDWDGDGLANEIDEEPYTNNGDCFGTGEGWWAANAAAVAATNANPAAYYWLEFAATKDKTRVAVTCDGASDLGDMVVIARTNEVCRVPLLIGATYAVRATAPLTGIVTSDDNAEVTFNDDVRVRAARSVNAPYRAVAWGRASADFNIDYPLDFFFVPPPLDSGRTDYALTSTPVNVGAEIASLSGVCCTNVAAGDYFNWDCRTGCGCGGSARAVYAAVLWEGYARSFEWWGECPCGESAETNEVHDATQPYLVMTMPRVLYTNNDKNNGEEDKGAEDEDIATLHLEFHSPVPTNGTLRLNLEIPNLDVVVWEESNRKGEFSFQERWDVTDSFSTNLYVEGIATDIMEGMNYFTFEWLDANGAVCLGATNSFTVYHPIASIVNNALYDNGDLCNPAAIVVGTNACFALEFPNFHPPAEDIKWSIIEGVAEFVGGRTGERVRVKSDRPNQKVVLEARIGDSVSRPIQFPAYVVDPVTVKATVWIAGNDEGSYYARSAAEVEELMAEVNKIYEQIGVSFYIDSISFTNRSEWLDLCGINGKCDSARRSQLVNIEQETGGVELYFVDRIAVGVLGNNNPYGAVIATNGTAHSVAHELGHAAKCKDIYRRGKHNKNIRLQNNSVCRDNLYDDWNNGTHHRYYASGITQEDIIGRMLMCGIESEGGNDMPLGMARGLDADDGERSSLDVGFFTGDIRKIPSHR